MTVKIDEIFDIPKEKSLEKIQSENEKLKEALFGEKEEKSKSMDPDILAKLKSKALKEEFSEDVFEETEEEVVPEVITQKEVSINMGVIGVGQGGSRIAEVFYRNGYDVGIVNTSSQDLNAVPLPPHQKLLLEGSLGGTGKSRELALDIFQDSKKQVGAFVEKITSGNDAIVAISSLGGGSGSGSITSLCELMVQFGKPIISICVLPKKSEGAANKRNSLEALSEITSLAATGAIDSLIVVDNARLEVLLSDVGHGQFWARANEMIVEPLTLLNHLTATSTSDAMDPSDFGKILTGGGLTIYGTLDVEEYMEETSLAEAIIESLSGNMLSEGFDLSQASVGGTVFVGNSNAINNIPTVNLDYAQFMVSEATGGADLYRGIYIDDSIEDDVIRIVSMFSGLGLPKERVDELQDEVEQLEKAAAEKLSQKSHNIQLDLNKNKTKSMKDKIHKKIANKKSGFNKLQGGARKSLIDKRRR